jgi:hypothetical protein
MTAQNIVFFMTLSPSSTVSAANTEPLSYVTLSVPCLIRRSYQEPASGPSHLKPSGHCTHFGHELVQFVEVLWGRLSL